VKALPVLQPEQRKGSCTRCGDCCKVVFLNKDTVDKIKAGYIVPETGNVLAVTAPQREDGVRCNDWIRNDLTEISANEAERLRPGVGLAHAEGVSPDQGMYTCRQYDWEQNLCKRHDDKPSICADFPHYNFPPGREDTSEMLYGLPNCGYWPDYEEEVKTNDSLRP
jgi:Fe-S-cluster containining protein